MINDQFNTQELRVLLSELSKVLEKDIEGDVVELGCYKGLTSIELQRRLANTSKQLYVYDSFSGLPKKRTEDISPTGAQFVEGELPANRKDVVKLFKQSGLVMPYIYKTWFKDITTDMLPEKICFAFLDGDFYDSIWDSLVCVWPLLSDGAVLVVDDYGNMALPGASKAVDEWLKTHKATIRIESSLAIIRPT